MLSDLLSEYVIWWTALVYVLSILLLEWDRHQ